MRGIFIGWPMCIKWFRSRVLCLRSVRSYLINSLISATLDLIAMLHQ